MPLVRTLYVPYFPYILPTKMPGTGMACRTRPLEIFGPCVLKVRVRVRRNVVHNLQVHFVG